MRFPKTQKGQGIKEYVIILAMVAAVVLVVLALVGPSIQKVFNSALKENGFQKYVTASYCAADLTKGCFDMRLPSETSEARCKDSIMVDDTRYILRPETCMVQYIQQEKGPAEEK